MHIASTLANMWYYFNFLTRSACCALILGCASQENDRPIPIGTLITTSAWGIALPQRDIEGQLLTPGRLATVYYFAGPECPICRGYSPDVARMSARDRARGIEWVMIFSENEITPEMIRKFQGDYSLAIPSVVDSSAQLACKLGITVIPSVTVIGAQGLMLYRGRLDNRYQGLGVSYGPPTKRDLDNVVNAVAAGKPLVAESTVAVGCVLPPCGKSGL